MIDAIRKHLETNPFVPFRIRMADGHEYAVPTIDRIYLPPSSFWVVVSDDKGLLSTLPARQVSGLLSTPEPAVSV